MSYKDFYLAFQDEAEANAVLYTVAPDELDADGNVISEGHTVPNFKNIDVLGVVYQPIPPDAPEGYVPVPYPAPNYGVNVRLESTENGSDLVPYQVDPNPFPQRVWG